MIKKTEINFVRGETSKALEVSPLTKFISVFIFRIISSLRN